MLAAPLTDPDPAVELQLTRSQQIILQHVDSHVGHRGGVEDLDHCVAEAAGRKLLGTLHQPPARGCMEWVMHDSRGAAQHAFDRWLEE
jgi:hypothetical protein